MDVVKCFVVFLLLACHNTNTYISRDPNNLSGVLDSDTTELDLDVPNQENIVQTASAKNVIESLKNNGFSCIDDSESSICTIKKVNSANFKYSQPISVVVPKGFESQIPQNIISYIHGHRGVCTTKSGQVDTNASPVEMVKAFDIDKSVVGIAKEKKNATLLVMPMSTGKNDQHKSELMGKYSQFMKWLEPILGVDVQTKWHMAGHSGAGSVISSALNSSDFAAKNNATVGLLDATYSMSAHIGKWQNIAQKNPAIKIQSTYIPGTSTESGSKMLASELNKGSAGRVKIFPASTNHCRVPNKHFSGILNQLIK